MPAQGRLGDKSSAPADAHGCPACPHPALGPAVGGSPDVLVNSRPSLRVGDPGIHAACCGPNTWAAAQGSSTVLINYKPAHRLGDQVNHCGGAGNLIEGSTDVIVGGAAAAVGAAAQAMAAEIEKRPEEAGLFKDDNVARDIVGELSLEDLYQLPPETRDSLKDALDSGWVSEVDKDALDKIKLGEHLPDLKQALKDQRAMLEDREASLERWNKQDREDFERWFGDASEENRNTILDRTDKELGLNKDATVNNFQPTAQDDKDAYAYVYPGDASHTIYIGDPFYDAPATGEDSKAGVLCHEMSHFDDVGGTDDHAYGSTDATDLANLDPASAMTNADNYEYYNEKVP